MNLTKEQIVQRLAAGTVMRGWSAIAALARSHINLLLRDQFLQAYTSHSFIEPMSNKFDLDEGGELRGEFRNLVFGPPQLSFEDATLLSAVTTVRMAILAGDYVQHAHLPGSPPIMLRAHSLDESMGYGVNAQVELKLQQSASGQYTQLMLSLSDARSDTLECDLGTTAYASKQIGKAVFSHWLKQPGYRQAYILAQFDREDYASMSPRQVKVLTQMAPWGAKTNKAFREKAASEGDGAVVLLMQTNSHLLPGTLPPVGHDFPYLLPGTAAKGAEASCTLLLDPVNEWKPFEPLAQVLRPVLLPNAHRYTYSAGDKFVPADVVGFGEISPTGRTCRIEPGTASTVASGVVPFKLQGAATAKAWTTTNLVKPAASGAISTAGVYTAGDADGFIADSQVSLVTGHYADGSSGAEQQRAALVIEHVGPVQISPRVMTTGANEVPILLSASSVDGGPLRWEKVDTPQMLRAAQGPQRLTKGNKPDLTDAYQIDLGKLEDLGNGQARFTPAKIAPGKPEILFQVIRATDTRSGKFADATVVIVTWPQQLQVEPFYVSDYKPNNPLKFSVDKNLPGMTWHWFGEGKIEQDGRYTPPEAAKLPVTVVMADYNDLNSGYAIIEHRPRVQGKPAAVGWDDLQVFSIEVISSDKCYANGMQQIEVKITIETKMNGSGVAPKISDKELASLELFNTEGGKKIDFLPAGEEGLEPIGKPGDPGNWAVGLDRNRVGARSSAARQEVPLGAESERTQRLFLMTTSVGVLFVAARFTAEDNFVYSSLDYNQGTSKVRVEGEAVPARSKEHYTFERMPVRGWKDPENFDNTYDTTDYWILAGAKNDKFDTLDFLRLKFEVDTCISMIRWESNQSKETFCSVTGYSFVPGGGTALRVSEEPENPEDPQKNIVYDGLLRSLVKMQVTNPALLDTELMDPKPGSGEVCFVLQRVSSLPIFYDTDHPKNAKWRVALENALTFRVMDQFGNWHPLTVSFHLPDGTTGSRDKLTFSLR